MQSYCKRWVSRSIPNLLLRSPKRQYEEIRSHPQTVPPQLINADESKENPELEDNADDTSKSDMTSYAKQTAATTVATITQYPV